MNTENIIILNLSEFDVDNIGDDISSIISDFSCPLNKDVEYFLHNNATEFTKKKQSVTYLVLSAENAQLLGYFSLTVKPITLTINKNTNISNTMRKKIERVSKFDEYTNSYTLAAYLIAQLGKNFSKNLCGFIDGSDLLSLAIEKIKEAQNIVGGVAVFLEAEDNKKLLDFYKNKNGFIEFGTRMSEASGEPHVLIQMIRILK
ncbi:MAG: GNAT family acetyltransferase [Oscillospiraceae bacterium]|nr:GNAT family acetyltransferase [Oscillospiraceae bacterium]